MWGQGAETATTNLRPLSLISDINLGRRKGLELKTMEEQSLKINHKAPALPAATSCPSPRSACGRVKHHCSTMCKAPCPISRQQTPPFTPIRTRTHLISILFSIKPPISLPDQYDPSASFSKPDYLQEAGCEEGSTAPTSHDKSPWSPRHDHHSLQLFAQYFSVQLCPWGVRFLPLTWHAQGNWLWNKIHFCWEGKCSPNFYINLPKKLLKKKQPRFWMPGNPSFLLHPGVTGVVPPEMTNVATKLALLFALSWPSHPAMAEERNP